jgi:hypothetical protein
MAFKTIMKFKYILKLKAAPKVALSAQFEFNLENKLCTLWKKPPHLTPLQASQFYSILLPDFFSDFEGQHALTRITAKNIIET